MKNPEEPRSHEDVIEEISDEMIVEVRDLSEEEKMSIQE